MLNVYQEIGDTSRRLILAELRTGPKNVSDLCTNTGLKQSNVSNHLARMRAKGIVKASKAGRQVWYTLGGPEVEVIVSTVLSSGSQTTETVDFGSLSLEYAKQAVQGNESECATIMDRAFRVQSSLIDIYERLLTPAMKLVGDWWQVKAIDESQEHMATAITERMMAKAAQLTGPMHRSEQTALLGCAPGCRHTVGLRMIGDYLCLLGWRVLFLGADVPAKAFLASVRQHRPNMVLLSCGAEVSVSATEEMLRQLAALKAEGKGFALGVGGGSAMDHQNAFRNAGANFVAAGLEEFSSILLPPLESA
ncbi:hypothetical protein BH11ARM2_BH11ARM2_15260 [soil metagenome]